VSRRTNSVSTSASSWTITMLTIPSRSAFLARALSSLAALPGRQRLEVVVVYNAATAEEPLDIETRIRALAPTLPVRVYVNATDPTIGGGRRMQLALCRTPMIAFMDDDLTVHGDLLDGLESAMRSRPLGLVGVPSFDGDSEVRVKPRDSTPSVDLDGIRYMPVQGMLVAGYRRLLADLGGFNPRREFWGEWTELNVRMWRHGIPTGYVLDRGFLRHWHDAPESPTRNMTGRERHVLWGLMCTALEYDAVSITEATDAFWRLAQDRYLTYSFGEAPSSKQLLATVLELMPRLSREWPAMHAFAEQARRHPFQFKPFEPLTEAQVREVLAYAEAPIATYRPASWQPTLPAPGRTRTWLRGLGQAVFGARRPDASRSDNPRHAATTS
jgi:hypothetical protein